MSNNLMFILIFVGSFLFSFFFQKVLIKISIEKKIFDIPNFERKLHKTPIPNIGGIAFFFTTILYFLFFQNLFITHGSINFLFAGNLILFLLGLKDDLVGLSSSKRFYAQILSGLIIIVLGNFRIQNLSIVGFSTISYSVSIFVSLLFFVLITNAYNLIDGINGLLGTLTIFSTVCFSLFFYFNSDYFLFALTLLTIASVFSFLYFNFGNAKIFMGSSGSYVIGSLMYFNSVIFLNQTIFPYWKVSKFSILFSILAIPLYDTIRVFIVRVVQKKSPFSADTNHIHHRLLKLKLSHTSTVFVILLVNIFLICISLFLANFNDFLLLITVILILIFLNFILEYKIKKNKVF
jgi:UDP-GlcNAc:undecaprenyl-phosphate GlcNAc-1-phosphate transferase